MSRSDFVHVGNWARGRGFIRRKPQPAPDPPPPPSPAPSLGVFAGVGAFTTSSPEVVFGHLAFIDWVAILSESCGGPNATKATITADEIRSAGVRVLVWETGQGNLEGQAAVNAFGAVGYIGQAESPEQWAATANTALSINVPCALITNVTSLQTLPSAWPRRPPWIILTECYENANPQATILNLDYEARKRGATLVAPTFGTYHEGDQGTPSYIAQLPLQHYLDEIAEIEHQAVIAHGWPHWKHITDFSFWTAEQLPPADWDALAAWRVTHPKT